MVFTMQPSLSAGSWTDSRAGRHLATVCHSRDHSKGVPSITVTCDREHIGQHIDCHYKHDLSKKWPSIMAATFLHYSIPAEASF